MECKNDKMKELMALDFKLYDLQLQGLNLKDMI